MPEAKRDIVRFAVYQRQDDSTEMVAYIIKDDDFEDHNEYMTENGYELCEVTQGETFKAITGEAFYIRIAGDLKMNTFGDHSYHHDRFTLMYLRNRTNRKDFFIKGVYRGRFQPKYEGKIMLQRLTVHAGTVNRGSGRQVALNNLESVLGKTVSTSAITLDKDKEDPAPPEVQDEFTDEELQKDVILRTISKDIPKEFVLPLAKHLFGLTETEVLNLSLLPHQRDFDEQRYYLLEKWKQSQEEGATFSSLINAFRAVKMTAAAGTLNRNLLTDKRLRMVAKGLPGDMKPLADTLGVDEENVKELYTEELTEFKFQILWRWREDSFEKLTKRACHSRLLKSMRNCGMAEAAREVSAITSVAARDVVILRIVTKDASRKKIVSLVHKLGLSADDIEQITKDHGQDFNKRLYLLNAMITWREMDGASFETLMQIMDENGMTRNADILDEELVSDKRLREAAAQIEHDLMQNLADELKVDTAPMMIPYDGNFAAEIGYRLLSRWKESRGKYASHTELMKCLEGAGLDGLSKDVDDIGSVDTSKGGMSDFVLRYVSSWCHVSRAHEWPSIVQNIPSQLVNGLDERTIKQIRREMRDPKEQMARALILCHKRGVFRSAGALVNRLIECGFEKPALTLLDVSRSQFYCTTLKLDEQ